MDVRKFVGFTAALTVMLSSSAAWSAASPDADLNSHTPLLIAQTGEPRTFTKSEQEEQFKQDEEAIADDRADTVAEGEMYRQDIGESDDESEDADKQQPPPKEENGAGQGHAFELEQDESEGENTN